MYDPDTGNKVLVGVAYRAADGRWKRQNEVTTVEKVVVDGKRPADVEKVVTKVEKVLVTLG